MKNRTATLWVIAIFLVATAVVLAQAPSPDTSKHAPMELFGMGPEMFADRAAAWTEAIGNVLEKAIAKLGVIAAAVILLVKNIKQSAQQKEIKERQDRLAERVHATALAVSAQPGGGVPVHEVTQPEVIAPAPGTQ